MDKNELMISFFEKATELYDEIADCEMLDPVEIESSLDLLQQLCEELESLTEQE